MLQQVYRRRQASSAYGEALPLLPTRVCGMSEESCARPVNIEAGGVVKSRCRRGAPPAPASVVPEQRHVTARKWFIARQLPPFHAPARAPRPSHELRQPARRQTPQATERMAATHAPDGSVCRWREVV